MKTPSPTPQPLCQLCGEPMPKGEEMFHYHGYSACPKPPLERPTTLKPFAYLCPGGCGCTWRDNGDETMSLYGANSKSCLVCEFLPLRRLIPLYMGAAASSSQWVSPWESADMFWDESDSEVPHDTPDDILTDYAPKKVVEITCAKRVPNFFGFYLEPNPDGDSDDEKVFYFKTWEEANAALDSAPPAVRAQEEK